MGGVAALWDHNTVYKNQNQNQGQWSKVLAYYRKRADGVLRTQERKDWLKNRLHVILYNICGKFDFGASKMSVELKNKLQGDNDVQRGIVRVFKKAGRYGQKLDIPTFNSWNYQYVNPFPDLTGKWRPQRPQEAEEPQQPQEPQQLQQQQG